MIDRKKINRDYIEMLLVIIPFLLALWNSFTIDSIQTPSNVDKVKCAALHLTVWLMVYSVFSQYMECVVPSKYDSVLILSAFVLLGSSLFQIYVYAQSDQDEPMQNNEYLQTSRKVFYLGTICFCFIYFLFGHVWSSAGQCIRFAGGTYAPRRILSRPRTGTGSKILGAVGAINSTINSDPAASGNISITSAAKRLQVAASMAAQAESQIASGISPSKNLERLEQAVELAAEAAVEVAQEIARSSAHPSTKAIVQSQSNGAIASLHSSAARSASQAAAASAASNMRTAVQASQGPLSKAMSLIPSTVRDAAADIKHAILSYPYPIYQPLIRSISDNGAGKQYEVRKEKT